MLGLLKPDSPHLGAILDMIRNPNELWSPFGIRSLSIDHPLFGQGENYWKGPIWMQMNYMVLSALHKVSPALFTIMSYKSNLLRYILTVLHSRFWSLPKTR